VTSAEPRRGTRFIVYGAGAIGGVLGARLFQHGHDVTLIARGPHFDAVSTHGLRLQSPHEDVVLRVPVVDRPDALSWEPGDVVLLTMKSQDTPAAVTALVDIGVAASTPVACVQNGVDSERVALRWFRRVYPVCVMFPAAFLDAGVVQASSSPVTGILDVGRYPQGADDTAGEIAAAFRASTFESEVRADIMRWKYAKLLLNLANAVEAVFGRTARGGEIFTMARDEGVACLSRAGIDFASEEEDRARRGDLLRVQPVAGAARPGGSSWQSLQRATGTIETGHLNGEIVSLGRLHGVATPVNDLLTSVALDMARGRRPPGTMAPEQFLAELERPSRPA
jgi:2-dehydropantoate 2-reductase